MAEERVHHDRDENPDVGYEVQDANVRQVVMAGIGLAAGTVLACFLVYFVFNLLKREGTEAQKVNPMAPAQQLPPAPRLQVRPWDELRALRAQEDQTLETYGWMDTKNGTVRIPVDKAMDIIAQRGLPTRTPGAVPKTAPPDTSLSRGGAQPQAMPKNSATPQAPLPKTGGTGAPKQ